MAFLVSGVFPPIHVKKNIHYAGSRVALAGAVFHGGGFTLIYRLLIGSVRWIL